jgi:hypothetical protein
MGDQPIELLTLQLHIKSHNTPPKLCIKKVVHPTKVYLASIQASLDSFEKKMILFTIPRIS